MPIIITYKNPETNLSDMPGVPPLDVSPASVIQYGRSGFEEFLMISRTWVIDGTMLSQLSGFR
jgi:hypothetical protein